MKIATVLLGLLSTVATLLADTAYGTLNNFDVVNDTGQRCYGFLIELDDCRSSDITYTYDWNHYGPPRIVQDDSDPAHPRVFIWHESKRNPDGSFASFTNPLDPAHPIGATSGHDCTNPSVNFGCEHFGVGLYVAPSRIRYNWLIEDPFAAGKLVVGPAVTISAPVFVYSPPQPPPVIGDPPIPAKVQAVVEPPEPEEPEEGKWGVPVWVKILKTVQPVGRVLRLDELVTDDETDDDDVNWDGDEEAETEIEWTIFQKRPPGDEAEDELKAEDELPEGDEMVTRRYEFYVYNGPVNAEDGEAQCDNPVDCEGAVGQYIGSQMAGFNVEAPLGLIDHLQDGVIATPYTDRTIVVGGNTPYEIVVTNGLPAGLEINPATGVLSGTPTVAGIFLFSVGVTDADDVKVWKEYSLRILTPLVVSTAALPNGKEGVDYEFTVTAEGGVPPYLWNVEDLPNGLGMSPTGVIAGKPGVGSAGEFWVTLSVMDSLGETSVDVLKLVIQAPDPVRGDLDGDRDVDLNDLAIIIVNRNKPASGPTDPRDLDKDGKITVLDARILTTLFTRPGGATK